MRVIQYLNENNQWSDPNLTVIGNLEELTTRERDSIVEAINSLLLDVEDIVENLPPDLQDILDELLDIRDNMPDWSDFEDRLDEIVDELNNTVSREEFEERYAEILEDLLERMENVREEIENARNEFEREMHDRMQAHENALDQVRDDLSDRIDEHNDRIEANRELADKLEQRANEMYDELNAQDELLSEIQSNLNDTKEDLNNRLNNHNDRINANYELGLEMNDRLESAESNISEVNSQIIHLNNEIGLMVTSEVVDAINNRVTDNEASITVLYNEINLNVREIELLEGRVTTNESNIQMLPDQILSTVRTTITDEMGNAIEDVQSTIDQQADSITQAVERIQTAEDNIVSNTTQIQQNTTDIALRVLQTDFDIETGRLDTITSEIRADLDGIDLLVQNLQTDFGDLSELLEYFDGDLKGLLEYLENIGADITMLESRISINEQNIGLSVTRTEFEYETGRLTQEISEIQVDINEITLRVDSGIQEIEGTLQQHQSQISMLNSKIELMVTSEVVDSINNRVTANEASITILNDLIELQVREIEYLEGRVSVNEASISVLPNQILSTVRETITDDLGNAISDVNSAVNQQADRITSTVESIERIDTVIVNHSTSIEQLQGAIELTVSRDELDEATGILDSRISQIAMDVDSITLEVRDNVRDIEAQISILNNEIGLFVRNTDFDAVANRLTSAEASIIVQEDAIRMRVERTEFDRTNEEFERLISEINIELGRIDLTVSQEIIDESFGVNQWIVTRYNVDLGSASALPSTEHIQGEQIDTINVRDSSGNMTAFTGDRFIAQWFTNIRVNTAQTVAINLNVSDSVRILLNGASIGATSGNNLPVQIAFRQGFNTLEILQYNHSGANHVNLGTELNTHVDRMTANIGIGDRDSTRVMEAIAGITIELDRVAIEVSRIEEIDGRITSQMSGIETRIDGIEMFANETIYNSFNQRIGVNESRIEALPSEISLTVREEFFDPLNDRYNELQSQIVMLNNEIALMVTQGVVDGLDDRLASAEAGITIALNEILLRVTNIEFNELTGRVERNEADISVMPEQILLRVVNEMIDPETQLGNYFESAIRMTSESIALEIVGREIDGITGAVREVESQISMINNEIGLLARRDELDSLGSRVSRNEAYINIADNRIEMAVRDIQMQGDRITSAESRIEMLPHEINLSVTQQIESIAVGTRNLIRNSAWVNGTSFWNNPPQASFLSETHLGLPVRRIHATGREDATTRIFVSQSAANMGSGSTLRPNTQYVMCGWFRVPVTTPTMTGTNNFFIRRNNGAGGANQDNSIHYTNITRGEWHFLSLTFNSGLNTHIVQTSLALQTNGTVDSTGLMLVEGSIVPTGWVPSPDDAFAQIGIAQDLANQVNNSIADISNDNVITPSEKQALARYRAMLNAERGPLRTQATNLGGLATQLTAEQNAWNALIGFIDPLLTNLNTTQNTNGAQMRGHFTTYTTAKTNLATAINQRFDDRIDGERVRSEINIGVGGVRIRGDRIDLIGNVTFTGVQNTANNAASAAASAQAEANRVAGITDGHQTQLTNIFASGTLTSVEIRQFRTMRDEIGQERGPIRTQATNLGGMATQLTNEQNAWNALNNFVNGLPTGVNATHNVAEATVRGHFTLHAQRKGELMGQIQLVLRQRADEAQSRADAAHSVGTAAQNTANATQGIVSANSARWGHAADRVNDWAVGAINGQTNINGGLIQTHTIRTEHLVADFFEGYEIRGSRLIGAFIETELQRSVENNDLISNTQIDRGNIRSNIRFDDPEGMLSLATPIEIGPSGIQARPTHFFLGGGGSSGVTSGPMFAELVNTRWARFTGGGGLYLRARQFGTVGLCAHRDGLDNIVDNEVGLFIDGSANPRLFANTMLHLDNGLTVNSGVVNVNGTIIETLGNASVFRAAAGRNIDLRDPTNTFRLTVRHSPNAGANQGHVGVNGNFNASGWISANSAGLWEGNNRALVQGGTAGNALHVRRGNLTVFPTANQNTTVRVYYTPSQMGSTPSQGQQFASANATTAVMGSAVLGISINDHRNYSVVVNLLRTNTTTTYTRWGVIWRAD